MGHRRYSKPKAVDGPPVVDADQAVLHEVSGAAVDAALAGADSDPPPVDPAEDPMAHQWPQPIQANEARLLILAGDTALQVEVCSEKIPKQQLAMIVGHCVLRGAAICAGIALKKIAVGVRQALAGHVVTTRISVSHPHHELEPQICALLSSVAAHALELYDFKVDFDSVDHPRPNAEPN